MNDIIQNRVKKYCEDGDDGDDFILCTDPICEATLLADTLERRIAELGEIIRFQKTKIRGDRDIIEAAVEVIEFYATVSDKIEFGFEVNYGIKAKDFLKAINDKKKI